ncbi:MAG: ribbon-helix-helix protein, CopG family [Firmicutes bacterium]|nr:ribbon-helix-helix protein, CopG family [Bacillota bacterium]
MVRTQVQLTSEQSRILRQLAAARGVSVAELIREGVQLLIATSGAADRARRIRLSGRSPWQGGFRSGVTDLSTRHDRYLQEVYGK